MDTFVVHPAYCRGCCYSLAGLPGTVCPECGREFDPENPRTFRRRPHGHRHIILKWFRRALLLGILFAILALPAAYWVWQGWRAEQPVIQQLHNLGAQVTFKPIDIWPLSILARERFGGIGQRVDFITFRHYTTKPADIEKLDFTSLHQLKSIIFDEIKITDKTVRDLVKIKSLEVLIMDWIPIDDAQLKQLSNLPNLWFLDIKGSLITDAGLVHLQRLTRLRRLDLSSTRITNNGLENLKNLKNIELLGLYGTDASSAAVAKLKSVLPKLQNKLYSGP